MKLYIGARVTRYGKPQLGVGTIVDITDGPRPCYVVEWEDLSGWCGFHGARQLRSERYAARNEQRSTNADLFFEMKTRGRRAKE